MKNNFFLWFLFLAFITTNVFAQKSSKKFNLIWKNKSELNVISVSSTGKSIIMPVVENGSIDENYLPIFNSNWLVKQNYKVQSYEIKNIVYKTILKSKFHKKSQLSFPKSIKSNFEIKKAKDKSYAVLSITPLLLKNGSLSKIVSFEIEYKLIPKISNKTHSTVHDSPLASGSWYKFAVDTTGVYKLSRSFISSLGFDTNVNPKNIKIYGNGGAMLNELNSDFRYDDLQENAILFSGEEDGSFDNNDFILFYAQGPNNWVPNLNTNVTKHRTNVYSNKAYYYITLGNDFGKRIQIQETITNVPDITINTFNDYAIHELDEINFDRFGQEFYGENFQIEETQNFTFNFTDLVIAEPIRIELKAGATSGSNFTLNLEGQNLINLNFGNLTNVEVGKTNTGVTNFSATNELINIELVFDNLNKPSTRAYLDYIEINGTKNLIAREKQFGFRSYVAANQSGIIEYKIQNSSNIFQIWNVTDRINVTQITNQSTDANFRFKTLGSGNLDEYIILNENDYYEPIQIDNSFIENQNLHAIQDIDYLIITPNELRGEAQRLANYHEENSGFSTLILNEEIIYNEFSSGAKDAMGIRDFIKHLYHNASSPEKKIKYVLFLGDSSFDHKNIEGNNSDINVIAFQSLNSLNLATSFVTDDFFGVMDDNEGFYSRNGSVINDMQDVATGRMPVKSITEAKSAIDRTLNYYGSEALGKWRSHISLIADDIDRRGFNRDLQENTEEIADNIKKK
jgi:hypothetical protein